MKHILIFLFFPIFLFGQIPDSYNEQLRDAQIKYNILKGEFDFVLDPIETVQVMPGSYALTNGNWAPGFLEVTENREYLAGKLNRKVVVFIHDTAGELDHTYLNRIARNDLSGVYTGEAPEDGHNHGTHVAGCVAAFAPFLPLGTANLMNEHKYIELVPHKVLNNNGAGQFTWATESLLDAIEKGKIFQEAGYFVIHNFSLGASSEYKPLSDAIEKAYKAGQLVVCASGNNGQEKISYPAAAEYSLAIGSLDETGGRSYYSNYGKELYGVAPGSYILSTIPSGGLVKYSGTSMATPSYAGLIAIVASIYPKATASQIKAFFENHSFDHSPSGWDKYFGNGSPKVDSWKNYEPDETVEDPDDPEEPETPTREKRSLYFVLDGYKTVWKTFSGSKFQEIELDFVVKCETKYYDDYSQELTKELVSNYFRNRAFVIMDNNGFVDAAYWARHFFEMMVDKSEVKLTLEEITVTDESGRTAQLDRKLGVKTQGKIKNLFRHRNNTFNYVEEN